MTIQRERRSLHSLIASHLLVNDRLEVRRRSLRSTPWQVVVELVAVALIHGEGHRVEVKKLKRQRGGYGML